MVMGQFWRVSFQLYLNSLAALNYTVLCTLLFWWRSFRKTSASSSPSTFFFCNMVIKGFKWHPIQKMASFCHPHLRNICPINWVSSRIAASMNGHFFRAQQAAVVYQHCTEVRFASFFSGGFITAIVVNSPERRLARRTSVHCTKVVWKLRMVGMLLQHRTMARQKESKRSWL